MSYSGFGRGGHLDPSDGREVVYCHNCSNEWYNDEHGLQCPRCTSEICEIIAPDNDPRDIRPGPPDAHPDLFRGEHYGPRDFDASHDHFSDPGEDDIDEVHGPAGFYMHRSIFSDPSRQRNDPSRGPGQRSPVDPSSEQEIFQRFQETINMLMGFTAGGMSGRSNRETLFGGAGGTGMRTTTFRDPGGRTSFTITTGAVPMRAGARGPEHGVDDFDMAFGNIIGGGGIRPPQTGNATLEGGLRDIFSLLIAQGGHHGVHGDAVSSQEDLDRIISQLMEANPLSNAAPPATQAAIEKLQKKKLDKEMLGENGKAECTICIDEMHEGDEVTVLPCKHWFHGECVVLWLKEHNTCPICRAPIEKKDGNNTNRGGNSSSGGDGSDSNNQQPRRPSAGPRFGGWFSGAADDWPHLGSDQPGTSETSGSHQNRAQRSREERERRLNAIRNVAGSSSYAQDAPDSLRNRRDSWSPTGPGRSSSSPRNRSPPSRLHPGRTDSSGYGGDSQRSSRSSASGNGGGGSSSNPLNWIRDRFTGSSGSGHGTSGSRRRS